MTDALLPATTGLLPTAHTSLAQGSEPPSEEQLLDLAREFESMLVLQMLRQMQRSVDSPESKAAGFGGGPLGDTLHHEVARQLSQAGGFGLGDVLVAALRRQHAPDASDPAAVAEGGALAAPGTSRTGEPTGQRDPVAVPLPIGTDLTSSFGWRVDPLDGSRRFHGGVDIRAAHGQEVPAARDGHVVFAGPQGGYGTTVVIEHDEGVRTRYAHLSELLVEQGETVRAGQPVGQVGQTGRVTGPHLHFEVLEGGQRLDPVQAARAFSAALKKVEQVADLTNVEPTDGSEIALE